MIIIVVETYTENIRRFYTRDGSSVSLGTLRSDDGDSSENFKKAIELITKTTILHVYHAFVAHSIAVTARLRLENAVFHDSQTEVHKRRRNFLSLSELYGYGYGS